MMTSAPIPAGSLLRSGACDRATPCPRRSSPCGARRTSGVDEANAGKRFHARHVPPLRHVVLANPPFSDRLDPDRIVEDPDLRRASGGRSRPLRGRACQHVGPAVRKTSRLVSLRDPAGETVTLRFIVSPHPAGADRSWPKATRTRSGISGLTQYGSMRDAGGAHRVCVRLRTPLRSGRCRPVNELQGIWDDASTSSGALGVLREDCLQCCVRILSALVPVQLVVSDL